MTSELHPEDVWAIEYVTSYEHYDRIVMAWESLIYHLETCVERYKQNKPADYDTLHLQYQADKVWEDPVIFNFKNTLDHLYQERIRFFNGYQDDVLEASGALHGINNANRGSLEFWDGWMTDAEKKQYLHLQDKVGSLASATINRVTSDNVLMASEVWKQEYTKSFLDVSSINFDLEYYDSSLSWIHYPIKYPEYRLNKDITMRTGEEVPQTGIYLPEVEGCAPQMMFKGWGPYSKDPGAHETIFYDDNFAIYGKPTRWFLIERISEAVYGEPPKPRLQPDPQEKHDIFVPDQFAGEHNIRSGWYKSACGHHGPLHFKANAQLPNFDIAHKTIWRFEYE